MLIDMSKIEIVPLDDLLLEKAGFKHGYYTHLVPKKITGKDGVERVHWVNPDKGKKVKLKRVAHHREGSEAEHHEAIKQRQIIDSKDLVRFSEGDKVVVTWGKDKGQEGVFRGALAGPSPRVSVAFLNARTGKYQAKTMNVNHINLVHRADKETKKVVEQKTVEATNLKGETILVDRNDYEAYYKDRDKRKTMQQKVAEKATRLKVGCVYRRPDGLMFQIKNASKIGDRIDYGISFFDSKTGRKNDGTVNKAKLQKAVEKHKYERVPRPTLLKKGKAYDETAKKWVEWATDKPNSADLESGELHKKGHFAYNDAGVRVASEADEKLAREILAEWWPMLERTVATKAAKFSAVSPGDITPADIIDGLVKAVASYEPLLDTGGGIEARLKDYAESYARSEAEKIHEREMVTVRDDFVDDGTAKVDMTPAVDKVAVKEALGDVNDIIASAFVSKHDTISLEEGLADEADMMSWLYSDEKILDIMKRWTGIGVFESTLTKKEAAAELTGLVYNPRTNEPYATSTIETSLLPKELLRIIDAFKAEGAEYPEFMATLKGDVNLRNKIKRNRKLVQIHPKDESVVKVVREDVKKPDHRAKFAAQLIHLGVPPRDVGAVMQLGDRILSGQSVPSDYAKQLPRRLWTTGAIALTAWFKDRLPESVFSGKRAAAMNLPQRWDLIGPIKAAIADEEAEKERRKQAAAREKAKARKTVDI